jgi:hypothetical protein
MSEVHSEADISRIADPAASMRVHGLALKAVDWRTPQRPRGRGGTVKARRRLPKSEASPAW